MRILGGNYMSDILDGFARGTLSGSGVDGSVGCRLFVDVAWYPPGKTQYYVAKRGHKRPLGRW